MSALKSRLVCPLASGWAFLALAFGASAEELWVPPTHSVVSSLPPALDVTWPVTSAGLAAFGFSIPNDMASFAAARVVILPSAGGSGTYSVFAEVKRDGEVISPFDIEAQQNLPLVLANDEVTEVDISSLFTGLFDAASGGRDYVSLLFYSPDLIANARVLGLRFVYDRSLIGSALLSANAVDSIKVLDGSLTGVDIANGSIGNVDIAANAIDGSKIIDHSVSSADIFNGGVTGIDIQDLTITNADISNAAAIGAGKIFGDAGVEFVDIGLVLGIPTTVENLGSLTLNAPTAGFALLGVSGYAVTFGDDTEVLLGLGTSGGAFETGCQAGAGTLDGTGTAREERPMAFFCVVPVSTGAYTFFVNAQKRSPFDATNVNIANVFAVALFVPKRY